MRVVRRRDGKGGDAGKAPENPRELMRGSLGKPGVVSLFAGSQFFVPREPKTPQRETIVSRRCATREQAAPASCTREQISTNLSRWLLNLPKKTSRRNTIGDEPDLLPTIFATLKPHSGQDQLLITDSSQSSSPQQRDMMTGK